MDIPSHIRKEQMVNLTQAVIYLLSSHREALEAQAAQFEAQGQQIRWGTDQLPRGVNRQATADQLGEAADKIRVEASKILAMADGLALVQTGDAGIALHGLSDFRAPGDELSDE